MSIKKFVKEHCPDALLPLLEAFSRAVKWPMRRIKSEIICHRALKYLPYYQDELSRKILSDRIYFLKTGDINVFIKRAEKEGWTFTGLYDVDGRPEYSYGTDSRTKYSDVLAVYNKEGSYIDYTRKLLTMIYGENGFRCIKMDKFLGKAHIVRFSLIVPVIEGRIKPASIREDIQYFDVFSPIENEIVVDAGAYDGTTALQFLEWGKGKVEKIYSFEFDPKNAERCKENLRPYADKVTLIPKGTWDKDEIMHVQAEGGAGSSINLEGNTTVYLTSIDNVVKDDPVTLIKMDVEGAELKSLIGARNTISKNHPRLAICVYHKPEDLYQIPEYILSLVPEYKFYLRHYSSTTWETVLYAYCN